MRTSIWAPGWMVGSPFSSLNSVRGTRPSDLRPKSTTTPSAVRLTTVAGRISPLVIAVSLYWSRSCSSSAVPSSWLSAGSVSGDGTSAVSGGTTDSWGFDVILFSSSRNTGGSDTLCAGKLQDCLPVTFPLPRLDARKPRCVGGRPRNAATIAEPPPAVNARSGEVVLGLLDAPAEVFGLQPHHPAHLVEAGAHALADAVGERVVAHRAGLGGRGGGGGGGEGDALVV